MAPKEKGPVFRVTGLPASQPDERLSELLKTTIHENLGQSESPFSVSIVPSCYYEDQEKVALVEFHGGVPAFLSKLKDDPLAGWQVEMGGDDINFDQHFFGFTQLYSPKQGSPVNADVIAITGLDGHAYGSWRGRGNLGRMWLRHFLERDLPTCRTMTYGYNSKLSSPGTDTLLDYGRGLLEDLKKIRHTEELRKRPLIFIAHSFGGIVLAHCLVRAVQSNKDDHPTIAALHKATYGMLLFGIPHKGLLIDDMEEMLAEQNSNVRLSLLEQIKSDSGLLAIQLADFKNLIRDRKVVSFYETRQTRQLEFDYEKKRWARSGDFVTRVDADSALLQLPDSIEEKIPLDADHSVIVKFDARNDRGYTSARGKLQQFEKDAPAVIAARFLQTSNKPSPSSTVPFMRDKDFVGRESVLTEIGEKLQDTVWQSHNRVALVGLGGIGKSQIAIEYTYRLRASDPNIWVFWVHASSPARFEKAYRDIASRVELSGYDDPKGDTLSLVHRWLCDDRNGRWLMVLDNADDSQIFAPHGTVINDTARDDDAHYNAAPLANYLPQTTNGKILVTSRDLIAALGLVGMESNVIRVNPMDEGEALKLLKSRISIEEALEDEARALTMALEYIPLAVSHAAAYIAVRRPRITVPTYLELFRESDKNQTHLLNVQEPRDIRRDSSVSHAVITTWQMSFEQIRKTNPKSADLLSLMAMFDRQVIPEEIVYFTESTVEFEDAVAALTSFSLIKSHITKRSQRPSEIEIQFGDRFFEMHSLVQLATREWLNIQGEIHKWRRRSLAVMATVLPDDQPGTILYEIPENLAIYQLLLPHAKKVLEYSSQRKREWLDQATIARKISSYLYQTGRYRESYDFCRSALDIREKLRGPQHEDTMECVRELGFILDCLERYQEAEVMARRDLEHCEKESGPGLLMSIRAFVARLLQQQGKYEEAQDMYRNVVKIYKDVFAKEDIDGRSILSIYETMTIAQDHCEESEAALRQALEGCMSVSGQASADTYLNMGTKVMVEMFDIMFTLQDNDEQAELLWLQTFKERARLLGPENSLTLDSMRDLGWIFQKQGKYKEAELMYQRALDVSERVLGLEHPTTVRNLYHIGSLWASQGMYEEAESILYRALEGSERVFGKTHYETFRAMDEIANFWTLQNKYEEAESILERVFDAKQQSFGPEHSSTLDTIFSLGSVYIMQGKYRDAEMMLEGALEGLVKAWIPKNADEIVTAHSLKIGRSWARKGKYKEATSMFRRALQGREKILGSEHQDTIETRNAVQYMVEMWEEAYYADSEFSSDAECSSEYAPDFERLVIEDE